MSMLPAAISWSLGFQTWVRFLSISVISALPRRPSVLPNWVANSSPPAPPPTMTMRWAPLAVSIGRRMFGDWRVGNSVAELGDGAQVLGRGGREAKELKIGWNLLEQHIRADLKATSTRVHRGQKGGHLALHHDFADEGIGRDAAHVHRQFVAFVHAHRRGVDDDVVARRIVAARADFDSAIVD